MDPLKRYENYIAMIETWLIGRFAPARDGADGLRDAMVYTLMAGGKRVRPVLCLEFARICGLEPEDAVPVACAVELLHTYSLIHDDLPCMDDDDERRGQPANHVEYGEGTAVLAGDCLQAEAFAAVCDAPVAEADRYRCCQLLAAAAGVRGLCAGQFMDLAGGEITAESLTATDVCKTAALMAAACAMGAAAAGADNETVAAARDYGAALGMAFQCRDDLLDGDGFAALLGPEQCQAMAEGYTQDAYRLLEKFDDIVFLQELTEKLCGRTA